MYTSKKHKESQYRRNRRLDCVVKAMMKLGISLKKQNARQCGSCPPKLPISLSLGVQECFSICCFMFNVIFDLVPNCKDDLHRDQHNDDPF